MKISSVHYAGLASILFENLNDENGFVIGRADKRYTLWRYSKNDDQIKIGYVQVLSNKRHRVELKFPGVYICEELRGEHRMILERKKTNNSSKKASAPKSIEDFEIIPFGNFSGMRIKEASDKQWVNLANYGNFIWQDAYGQEFNFEELVMNKLKEFKCQSIAGKWYTVEQMQNPKLWMYLANTATDMSEKAEFDSMCRIHGLQKLMGRWYSPIALDGEKPWMTTARQILPLIENGKAFSFVAHFNGNEFFFGVTIKFKPEDKDDVYTYYGSSHFLKITNKKGVKVNKRVKGKTIEITDYDILTDSENRPYVMVNKFNIK